MKKHPHSENTEKIPVFKSWAGWYWLTIILLLIQVLFYFFLTKTFE